MKKCAEKQETNPNFSIAESDEYLESIKILTTNKKM